MLHGRPACAKTYLKKKRKEKIYAALFGCFLIVFFMSSLAVAFFSSGPIVLGTELNGNGSVEYLCLGDSCEGKRPFRWSDKGF